MDFQKVLSFILNNFDKEKVRYALIGGFALGLLEVPRATVDLDFLVHREDLEKVDSIMKSKGYKCVHKSENVSQYLSVLKIFGEVDFLHAFRTSSLGMLERAEKKTAFSGSVEIKVLRPEDIIGLKLQAAVNNPNREIQEFADIEALIHHHGKDLDWELLASYFSIFDQNNKFAELRQKYHEIK